MLCTTQWKRYTFSILVDYFCVLRLVFFVFHLFLFFPVSFCAINIFSWQLSPPTLYPFLVGHWARCLQSASSVPVLLQSFFCPICIRGVQSLISRATMLHALLVSLLQHTWFDWTGFCRTWRGKPIKKLDALEVKKIHHVQTVMKKIW